MKGPFRASRHTDAGTHACPHPGCTRQVPPLMWACFEHWQALPVEIRQDIWTAGRGTEPRTLVLRTATERALAFWEAQAAAERPAGRTERTV